MKNTKLTNIVTCQIIDYLTLIGCKVWRNNTGSIKVGRRLIKFGLKGSSDIIGWNPAGRFIGIEIKTGNDKLSDDQKDFIYEGLSSNCIMIVASCIDDVISLKNEILEKE